MTQNLTYTPNFMEKLLGKWYKWWYMLKYHIYQRTTYQIDNSLFAIGQVLVLLGTVLTWFAASGANFDTEFKSRLTYFIVGTIFLNFINTWPSFYGYSIKNGKHTQDLLYPCSTLALIWAKSLGTSFYQNIVVIFIISLFSPIWMKLIEFQTSWLNIIFLLLLIPISHLILFFIELLVGFMAFFITEINGLSLNFGFVRQLLSGQMFPLSILIASFSLNLANPFSFLFYHPMQIYLGKYDTNQTILVFLGGILWCIILYFLAKLVFKLGLKRNESVGL